MSYIDTFPHELVGYLAGIPLYHPLTTVEGEKGTADFGCSRDNLVLGGGSGEHPGLVFHRLDLLVRYYLDELQDEDGYTLVPAEVLRDSPGGAVIFRECLEFCGWSIADTVAFAERCRSNTLPRPFDVDCHGSIEMWLALTIGELVWRSLPHLVPSLVDAVGDSRQDILKEYLRAPNVLMMPPGFERDFTNREQAFQAKLRQS
jgi:hypothetical protein